MQVFNAKLSVVNIMKCKHTYSNEWSLKLFWQYNSIIWNDKQKWKSAKYFSLLESKTILKRELIVYLNTERDADKHIPKNSK